MKIDSQKIERYTLIILQSAVLVSSILLIVYMSYFTFNNIPFLTNERYLHFQLIVCAVFLADFLGGFIFSKHKKRYLWQNLFFLIISVPYINIIHYYNLQLDPEIHYYIFLVPLVRAAFALAIVVGYVSSNKVSSLFASYIAILLSVLYFSSLIFYQREFGVNPQVNSYFDSLYWASTNVTTLGSSIQAVTTIGKVLTVVLGCVGMLMFPLFTVYVTNLVQQSNTRSKYSVFRMELNSDHSSDQNNVESLNVVKNEKSDEKPVDNK